MKLNNEKRLFVGLTILFLGLVQAVEHWHIDNNELNDHSSYMKRRSDLIKAETKKKLGGRIVLSPKEKLVDKYFLDEKQKLMEQSRVNRTVYKPAESFYYSKQFLESSKLFKAFRQMPKGAVLHTHDLSSTSLEWLIQNVTYRDNLYFCVENQSYMIFRFFRYPPQTPGCNWQSLKEARAAAFDVKKFDESLKNNLSLLASDPLTTFADDNAVWDRFGMYFKQVTGMIYHIPVFEDYMRQMLIEFYEDNVQYIELRAQLFGLFDLDGNEQDAEFGLNLMQSVTEEFVKDHPDFLGAKFIFNGIRALNQSMILDEVKTAMKLHAKYPNSMLGYDLVGQEPCYHSLFDYLDALLYPSSQDPPFNLPYFFHAGETTWEGTAADYNLVDAILLNTTRIGHGYALDKHPILAKLVKARGIAIEVNPISNQLLRLVNDLRNHPMVPLMTEDFPIVISSDDSSTWEAYPLTHDFFVAFLDMCGEEDGLAFLKQLAINSIKYSVLTPEEQHTMIAIWKAKWDKFIGQTIFDIYGQ